jgi:uncharacterized membrane protein YczE
MPLAGEGTMQAVSDVTGIIFSKVKIGFDVSMVIISLVTCLIALRSMGSVGLGTIIAAFLVGFIVGKINHYKMVRTKNKSQVILDSFKK